MLKELVQTNPGLQDNPVFYSSNEASEEDFHTPTSNEKARFDRQPTASQGERPVFREIDWSGGNGKPAGRNIIRSVSPKTCVDGDNEPATDGGDVLDEEAHAMDKDEKQGGNNGDGLEHKPKSG